MNHVDKYIKSGDDLYAKGRYDNALSQFNQAVYLNPYNVSALTGCGHCWNLKQGYESAKAFFKKALAIDPEGFSGLSGMGYALYCVGDLQNAMKYYEKAAQVKPDDYAIFNHMGHCHYWLKDNANAAKCLNRAIELKPDYSSALLCRGYVHYFYSDYDKSISDFINASSITDDVTTYCPLGYCWFRKWNFEKAISYFDKAVVSDRNDAVAFDGRGAAFGAVKDYIRAIQDFDCAISIQPDNPFYYQHRGLAWKSRGNNLLAEKDLAAFHNLQKSYNPKFDMNSVLALKSLEKDVPDLEPVHQSILPVPTSNDRRRLINQACDRLRFLSEMMLKTLDQHMPTTTLDDAVLRLRWKLDNFQMESAKLRSRLAAMHLRRGLLAILSICERNVGKLVSASMTTGMPGSVSSWQQFHNLVSLLPEDQSDVFGMIWYLGMTIEETASVLEIPPSSVANLWQSARLQLAMKRPTPPPDDDDWTCQDLIRNAG